MQIKELSVREVKTSAGKPTVELSVNDISASVPSGTSAGKYEVGKFAGTVKDSINLFNKEARPHIIGMEFENPADIFSIEKQLKAFIPQIGGNIVLCLSYALLRNLNKDVYKLLGGRIIPYQVCNIIGGGLHAQGTEFQELLVIPMTKDYVKSIAASKRIHKLVGERLKSKDLGIEGAWVSKLSNEDSLELLYDVAESVSNEVGFDIMLGLDIAATHIYKDSKYIYRDKGLDKGGQIEFVLSLIKRFKLQYVEDPLHEDDFDGFAELQKKTKCMIVGDDLFVTNIARLKPVCKAAIVKPNQIGMLHSVIDFMQALKHHKMTAVMSHRSQETEDTMIADLAVGMATPYLKLSVYGKERLAKMQRLKEIYDSIKPHA
jgi:enolase